MNRLMISAAAIGFATLVNLSPSFAQQSTANAVPNANAGAPHYEWQYHYVGRHARYQGHWVLVR